MVRKKLRCPLPFLEKKPPVLQPNTPEDFVRYEAQVNALTHHPLKLITLLHYPEGHLTINIIPFK